MDAIDTGLVGVLANDATLTALAPGGVFWSVAPIGAAEPFVLLEQLASEDDYVLPATRRIESRTYVVKACAQSASASSSDAAAARIDALLDHGTLTASGYGCMVMRRESRIRYVEPEADLRWQHSGGQYLVMMRKT